MQEIKTAILEPVIRGMQQEGHPYQGILYAGLMMTAAGPKVVEFNCRFGDPETQVILPLLTCDLIEIAQACIQGRLRPEMVTWKKEAAVTVVLAAPGYPGNYPKGLEITGVGEAEAMDRVMVWHAGTAFQDGRLVTNGGRVLNVIATGPDIQTAVDRVYQGCHRIAFEGMQYRTDIGHRALARLNQGVRHGV
jgi:phosphoribosylamine--glycine ligase